MESLPKTNRLRTPPRVKDKLFFSEKNHDSEKTEDKCKIHLAEIYTQNKKIDKLNSELEEKIKNETVLQNKLDDCEISYTEKVNKLHLENNDQKVLLEELLNKIKILEQSHCYYELIEYYEKKFEEAHQKNVKNMQMFTQMLNKITLGSGNYNTNRDDVWRNLIKKYGNKIIELETQIAEMSKKERKIFSRQRFFEQYCFKAEEKIEKFSKISKKFYDQENKISVLKSDVEKYQNEFKMKTDESEILNKEIEKLKNENQNIKKFVNKIKPILKVDWEEIRKNNEENFEKLIKNSKNEEFNYNSKNIIILIENLSDFLIIIDESHQTIKEVNPQLIPEISPIKLIVDDIKNYTIMLLKKIQLMTINQYHIINTCCELNDKINAYVKNNKVNFDFLSVLKEIRNACSKLLFDYNPK